MPRRDGPRADISDSYADGQAKEAFRSSAWGAAGSDTSFFLLAAIGEGIHCSLPDEVIE